MPNATPRDTRAGFDIYRSSGGDLDLADVNTRLFEAGYGPIAQRTLTHYRHLLDAGYNRYVSINRFDVARAAEPYENAAAIGRYRYVATDLGVNVIFAKGSRLFEGYGRATELGEVGALLRFEEPEVIDGLRAVKPQIGDMVTVRFLEPGRSVAGIVVDADTKTVPAIVEIEYTRLISMATVGMGEPLPTSDVYFRLEPAGHEEQTLDLVGGRLYQFFEFVEGLRTLSNEYFARQSHPTYAEPPVLRKLTVASPLDLVIQLADQVRDLLPYGLIAGLLGVAGRFVSKRKEWYEGTGQKKQNTLADLEIELKQLEVDQRTHEAELRAELLRRLKNAAPDSTVSDDEAMRMLDEYVLAPLRSLGRAGVVDVEAPTRPPDDSDGPL